MHEKILNLLLEQNEVTWQDIIYGLIKTEEMDPWDVDISLLTQHYIETVKGLQEINFFVSGKVLFAAAFLVKIKSDKLVNEDIAHFDSILFPSNEVLEDDMDMIFHERPHVEVPPLGIKTPQARKRKVTVQDLVKALERALEVNKRRIIRYNRYRNECAPTIPEKKVDITELIKSIFEKIKALFQRKEPVTFTKLLPEGGEKKEKILTFLSLLHLNTEKKIWMQQDEHFGEIYINMPI